MRNILLIIPENTGTIASVSFDLYLGLRKQHNIIVYVACLGPYSDYGFQFDNVLKLGNEVKGSWGKIYSRTFKLRKIKKKYAIEESISTLLGATYWNVLSSIGEYKIGLFHTKLSQRKSAGRLVYAVSYLANKILCPHLDKLIAVNKTAFNDLAKMFGITPKIELAYNIHNFNRISELSCIPLNKDEASIFKTPVILYVGGLYHNVKGTDRLIKAFETIHEELKSYSLVFIGGDYDNSLPQLKTLVQDFQLENKVFFFGKKDNPYMYMKKADMLISPSRDEGLPGVLIEALSLGIKCVATNSSEGVWEIMECDNEYSAGLHSIKKTNYGYITPNIICDENFTIACLASAILNCAANEFQINGRFNKARFSEEQIIPHYLPNR